MIKSENGATTIDGKCKIILADYFCLLKAMLEVAPEIVLAVHISCTDDMKKHIKDVDPEVVASLSELLK